MQTRPAQTRSHTRLVFAAGCTALLLGCISTNTGEALFDDASAGDAEATDAQPPPQADAGPPADAQPSQVDAEAPADAQPSDVDSEPPADAQPPPMDAEPPADAQPFEGNPGSHPQSCGAPDQELEPVDCTEQGDVDAVCVFSNHCLCSDGFVCAGEAVGGECEAGAICVPE
ncbi:MAG: type IV secretory pathway VirB10-like protein [Bradymonadia bacterium]|jgi:type IV secretory pathway VirB10-like protein